MKEFEMGRGKKAVLVINLLLILGLLKVDWYCETKMNMDEFVRENSSGIDVFSSFHYLYLITFVVLMIIYMYHLVKEKYTMLYVTDVIMGIMFTGYPVLLFGINFENIKLLLLNFTTFYSWGYFISIFLLLVNVIAVSCLKKHEPFR